MGPLLLFIQKTILNLTLSGKTLSYRSQIIAEVIRVYRHITWVFTPQAGVLFGNLLTYMTFSRPLFLAHV